MIVVLSGVTNVWVEISESIFRIKNGGRAL